MSTDNSFAERIARIEARQPQSGNHAGGSGLPPFDDDPNHHPRGFPLTTIITVCMSLTGLAVIVLYSLPMLEPIFPKGARLEGTFLERSIESRMTAEEIRKMETDPDLQGMTRMEKLLMSH